MLTEDGVLYVEPQEISFVGGGAGKVAKAPPKMLPWHKANEEPKETGKSTEDAEEGKEEDGSGSSRIRKIARKRAAEKAPTKRPKRTKTLAEKSKEMLTIDDHNKSNK
jgi:hypothetical protein